MMKDFPDFTNYGYQIKRELGQNRAGGRVTYLATEINTQRSVVVKQFQFARTGASWLEYDAFEREIQVLRRLDHPSIPQYLDSFQTPAGFCMVQEYKDAPSLATSRRWKPQEIKQIAIFVLEILKYLQSQMTPVIHRDLKPENILVDKRMNVFLVDFGFARTGGGEVAASSVVKGTLGFMPPEQMFNRHLSAASDLYSLGATLICLLTNTLSTEVGTLVDDAGRINFKQRVPKLNPGFIDWLQKMVEPNVRQRYPNAAEALDALIPLQVLRPVEIPKVPVVAAGLLAVGVAFCVPVVMKFSEPKAEPDKVGEVTVTAEPIPARNRVSFSVKIHPNTQKIQAIGTCGLFDQSGILVAKSQSQLQVGKDGLLSASCSYDDLQKLGSPGKWTFKFHVDGKKAVQENFTVLGPEDENCKCFMPPHAPEKPNPQGKGI
jgi:serine/threonine protein kinase